MDDLTKDLLQLTRSNKNGSFATQKNRKRGLTAMAGELDKLGYQLQSAKNLKPKHVQALINHWHDKDCTTATIRNRLSWIRWWASKINKANVVERDNSAYKVGRQTRRPQNRAQALSKTKLQNVKCQRVQASLLLQAHFGLRREEAIKFTPNYAIQKGQIRLKPSWTKGGRARTVPISTKAQREALEIVQKISGSGSLIPANKNYRAQLKRYEAQTSEAGFKNTHGLRHQYAQNRYLKLTGAPCPLAGGKGWKQMNSEERKKDRQARKIISGELGHNRLGIVDTYIGRAMS